MEILGRYPVLEERLAADLLHFVAIKEVPSYSNRVTRPAPLRLTFQSQAMRVVYSSLSTGEKNG